MSATPPPLATTDEILGLLGYLQAGNTLGPLMGHSVESQEALYYVAFACYGQAKYLDAMRFFAHLLTVDHLDRRYHNGFAACHQMLRNFRDAQKYYGIASMLDLTDPEPVIHIAECHLALGERAEAKASLEYALAQARGNAVHNAFVERIEGMLAFLDNKSEASPSQEKSNE